MKMHNTHKCSMRNSFIDTMNVTSVFGWERMVFDKKPLMAVFGQNALLKTFFKRLQDKQMKTYSRERLISSTSCEFGLGQI